MIIKTTSNCFSFLTKNYISIVWEFQCHSLRYEYSYLKTIFSSFKAAVSKGNFANELKKVKCGSWSLETTFLLDIMLNHDRKFVIIIIFAEVHYWTQSNPTPSTSNGSLPPQPDCRSILLETCPLCVYRKLGAGNRTKQYFAKDTRGDKGLEPTSKYKGNLITAPQSNLTSAVFALNIEMVLRIGHLKLFEHLINRGNLPNIIVQNLPSNLI